jgi:hypothetical protein
MNHKHRAVLHALFSHPVSNNIDPKEVKSMFEAMGGEISHGGHGHLIVRLSPSPMNADFRVQKSYVQPVLTFWQGTIATPPSLERCKTSCSSSSRATVALSSSAS